MQQLSKFAPAAAVKSDVDRFISFFDLPIDLFRLLGGVPPRGIPLTSGLEGRHSWSAGRRHYIADGSLSCSSIVAEPVFPGATVQCRNLTLPQQAYNHSAFFEARIDITKDNTPPDNVRISDWHVWKVVAAKVPGKVRGASWAADFNTEGDIRTDRKPLCVGQKLGFKKEALGRDRDALVRWLVNLVLWPTTSAQARPEQHRFW